MNTKKSSNDQEVRVYSRFNPPPQVGVSFENVDSLTFQCFKDDCDINHIMARYREKGILTHLKSGEPQYGDFSTTPEELHEAYELVDKAQSMFASLPSSVRDRFDHDPVKFFDFYNNEDNNEELVKLGLKSKPVPAEAHPIPPEESKPSPA